MKNTLFSARNLAIFGLFLCVFLMCEFSFAQVNVTPAPFVKSQYFNGNSPCNACQLFTYAAGTTTPLVSYTDSTGITPNADPVVLDTNGYGSVWLGPSAYKLVLKTSGGATIWTVDGVSGWYANFLSLNGGNALTAISDPAASLGKFWLSSTNAGRIKWSDASAIHTVVGADTTDTESNKTLNQPLVVGVTDGSSAAAGNVGQFVQGKQATPQTTTSTVVLNLTSISLTAGDWDIQANAIFSGSSTTVTQLIVSINTLNNSINPTDNSWENGAVTAPITGTPISSGYSVVTNTYRVSLASTTTYFLNVECVFGSNACSAAGSIRARRVR